MDLGTLASADSLFFAGLPSWGTPGLPGVRQAESVLRPIPGQAFGQARLSSVHGTTSTWRCAVHVYPVRPVPDSLRPAFPAAGGWGASQMTPRAISKAIADSPLADPALETVRILRREGGAL
ncbi:hypothetical protein SVTN_40360 (plasmid) [Streptomyces vietnamensis]|uniref:Uncharacterized protein n=1 Tax=Streptomyces vietnamensis TaxID=362257 RepID=A0A0B5IIY5_9ACTN|nr:hypothetical protein SVTN_40360 [Streptomyces vietnamensis]